MSNITIITGNIFNSSCQTIVNTVNCVGVMGAGIALECRLRYPDMFAQYTRICHDGLLDIGKLWLYKGEDRWILNFPTKKHWKFPSKEIYLRLGLEKFIQTQAEKRIESIAFPILGAQHGGLNPEQSLGLMQEYLQKCSIPIEIYRYDPKAPDDLYDRFKIAILSASVDELKQASGLRSNYIQLLKETVESRGIYQLNQLAACKGIGDKTLEKAFAFMRRQRQHDNLVSQSQLSL